MYNLLLSMAEVESSRCLATPVEDLSSVGELLKGLPPSSYSLPSHESKIYKDECMYCYHTPYHPGGLYVCLKTLCAFCGEHAQIEAQKGKKVYLQITSKKNVKEETDEPKDKIKRLAIGMDEGFNDKVEVDDDFNLVVFPHLNIRIPISLVADLPIGTACERIANTTSAERLELLQCASNAWDGEMKEITKHADMQQCENARRVASCAWICDVEGCGLTENLWLNLYDGAIRCGRSQLIGDGVRSKGNNHMRMYYEEKKYPLVVKLGTIEENGTADVYSYDEDNSVINPNLQRHLAHFGLNMKEMTKTEKSTIELELDINQKWEWAACQEDGEHLENVYGPHNTGIINIGSSCYINSVVQSLMCIGDFVSIFSTDSSSIFATVPPSQMGDSLIGQCAKLFSSLTSGHFSRPPPNNDFNGVKPTQFKRIVGRGNAEFCSARQQDAEEYIRYLMDKISAALPPSQSDPSCALRFNQQVRLVDVASGKVRYSSKEEMVLSVPIPKTHLVPVDNEALRFSVQLDQCISASFAEECIEGFKSPITGEVKGATTCTKMATFPDFLIIQVKRFEVADDLTVKKMDVDVLVNDRIDLSAFRATQPHSGEEMLPEDESPQETPFNEHIVSQLQGMGFTRNASIKAALATNNSSVEVAADWMMSRLDDPTLNDPPHITSSANPPSEHVEQLMSFGFTGHEARFALKKERDVNGAAEWLFSHANEVPEEKEEEKRPKEMRDGCGVYELTAFISHMGSSPHSGHYVCHVLRDARWILFNDEKVAYSKNPPKHLAYLYLYKRI